MNITVMQELKRKNDFTSFKNIPSYTKKETSVFKIESYFDKLSLFLK